MSLATRVSSLLQTNGAPVTVVRKEGATFDAVAGKYSGGSDTTYNAFGVVTNDKDSLANALRGVGTQDVVMIMDTTFQPELGDKVTLGDQTYSVKEIDVQYYKNVPVFYTVRLVV